MTLRAESMDDGDFPSVTSDVSPYVCPKCGGRKRAKSVICAKCERLEKLDGRLKATKPPPRQIRDQYREQPPPPAIDQEEPREVLQAVIGDIQEKAADAKKIQGWDADDLDMVVYLLSVGVFIGIGWATTNATSDREYAPQFGEVQAVCMPLARMIARRVKVPGMKSGDFKDALAVLAGVAAYGMRCYNVADMRREERLELARSGGKPDNQRLTEAITPPIPSVVMQPATATVPPPNGNGHVVTGRAAIPPQMRATLEQQGRFSE